MFANVTLCRRQRAAGRVRLGRQGQVDGCLGERFYKPDEAEGELARRLQRIRRARSAEGP
jgi:hypothetical protein